ncbi:hypothetical protein MGYG_02976 [Nannizzia gypsea CBS 118893]|uniref:Uncharacterized protein n=1 Tax=Arthroderma gypseum (strain ATCC MYA-4604 / CBS 118893) TaxID=535722 RepID=E4UQ49_ARTGP|nr:hypothetical protein MGYG_02976 [Nannizzia gypsea CBS 118893]EFQ99968.1 hypothetical protein MGYG_02976 [Nannizzia gypsea CBS 118893]
MKFQAVLVFFAGALLSPLLLKRSEASPLLELLVSAHCLQTIITDKVAPSTGLQNLPAAGLVQGLPIAGGLLGGGVNRIVSGFAGEAMDPEAPLLVIPFLVSMVNCLNVVQYGNHQFEVQALGFREWLFR